MSVFQYWLWAITGLLFGGAIGFVCMAYLIKPSIYHWEDGKSLRQLCFAVFFLLAGSGGGATIAANFAAAPQFYLIGSAIGLILGCFHQPILIQRHSHESVQQVLRLDRGLGKQPIGIAERAAVIQAVLSPIVSESKSNVGIADDLENGLDDIEPNSNGDEDSSLDRS